MTSLKLIAAPKRDVKSEKCRQKDPQAEYQKIVQAQQTSS